jgi:hypothetical protein
VLPPEEEEEMYEVMQTSKVNAAGKTSYGHDAVLPPEEEEEMYEVMQTSKVNAAGKAASPPPPVHGFGARVSTEIYTR